MRPIIVTVQPQDVQPIKTEEYRTREKEAQCQWKGRGGEGEVEEGSKEGEKGGGQEAYGR